MNPTGNVRRLRRKQSPEEKQLWQALRAGRFAGFKFRRQHPVNEYVLDFYCPMAQLSVELDGFQHGVPKQLAKDIVREKFLANRGIEEVRFWNHQWRKNREGVLLEIWHAVQRRTGCTQVMRKLDNQRYVPPPLEQLGKKPNRKPDWENQHTKGRGMQKVFLQRISGVQVSNLYMPNRASFLSTFLGKGAGGTYVRYRAR